MRCVIPFLLLLSVALLILFKGKHLHSLRRQRKLRVSMLTPKQQKLDDLSVSTFRKREKLKDDINKIFVQKFEKRPIEIFPDVLIGGSKKCGSIVRLFNHTKNLSF